MSRDKHDPTAKPFDRTFEIKEASREETDEIVSRLPQAGDPASTEALPPHPEQPASIGSITFDGTGATGKLHLRTANSTYTFSIVDPARRSGILTGGAIGDRHVHAILMDGLDRKNKSSNPVQLIVGGRALFFIETGRGFSRIVTSRIVELRLDR